MSKKEEKNHHVEKKSFQRWHWLEKRHRRRKRRNHLIIQRRNITSGNIVQSTPPLRWSSTSLLCHLSSRHDYQKNCIESLWTWSPSNSTTILDNDNKHILFHPRVSSSTQVILADRPLPSYGRHYWEIYVPSVYGTSLMFGIATREQKLTTTDFTNLIGIDEHGWGLSHQGLLWHRGQARSYSVESFEPLQPVLVALEFDADHRTLSYTINNQSLGIAFDSIPKHVAIYPAVSSTSAQSTMVLKHCCQLCLSLREICWRTMRSKVCLGRVDCQLLPPHLIRQLTQ